MNPKRIVAICKALGDAHRLKIVQTLCEGEQCGYQLLQQFNFTQPTLSHHMRILCMCELVDSRKDGRWHYYSLNQDTLNEFKEFSSALAKLECKAENNTK